MRLFVALETHLTFFDGEAYSTNLTYDGFWQRYRSVFEEVLIVARARRVDSLPPGVARATGPGVGICPIPDFLGPWQFLANRGQVKADVHRAVDDCDAHILRVPGTLGTIAWKRLRKQGRPFGVEVVGDPWDSLGPGSVKTIVRPIVRRTFTRNLKRQCREAVTSSYVTAEALQRRYPANLGGFTTSYSSIELPDEAVVQDVSERLRGAASLPARAAGEGEPVRLGYIGTLSQMYKAPDIHIAAVAKCVSDGLNVALNMVGDGQFRSEMADLAAKLGVGDRVNFLGKLEGGQPIFDFLDSTDLFLNASRQEGLPRALIEAMSRGCPAIGTNLAGIPELLEPGHLVPVDDVETLASRIESVLADGEGLQQAVQRNVALAGNYIRSILNERRREHYAELRARTESRMK